MKCACYSDDAHNCWSLRYHGHSGASELTVANEGGPCECACHEEAEDDDWYEEPVLSHPLAAGTSSEVSDDR